MNVLEAVHLRKTFFDPKQLDVLQDISLSVNQGESVAIVGRSGEGKTTLLNILGTLEKADGGSLSIAETLVTERNAHILRQKHVGFIFQAFNLLEELSVLDNVLMPARIARKSIDRNSLSYVRVLELIENVDLADRAHTPAKLLSGGERQRVAIARALCNDPSIILADEPSGNLDRANAQRVGELLTKFIATKKKSLILVTHDSELAALCDRKYVLKDGTLI